MTAEKTPPPAGSPFCYYCGRLLADPSETCVKPHLHGADNPPSDKPREEQV